MLMPRRVLFDVAYHRRVITQSLFLFDVKLSCNRWGGVCDWFLLEDGGAVSVNESQRCMAWICQFFSTNSAIWTHRIFCGGVVPSCALHPSSVTSFARRLPNLVIWKVSTLSDGIRTRRPNRWCRWSTSAVRIPRMLRTPFTDWCGIRTSFHFCWSIRHAVFVSIPGFGASRRRTILNAAC